MNCDDRVPSTSNLLKVTLANLGMIGNDFDINWDIELPIVSNGKPHPLNFCDKEEINDVALLGYTQLLVARSIYQRFADDPPLTYNRLLELAERARFILLQSKPIRLPNGQSKQAPFISLIVIIWLLAQGQSTMKMPEMTEIVFGKHCPASLACSLEPAYLNRYVKSCIDYFLTDEPRKNLDARVILKTVRTTVYKGLYSVPVLKVDRFDTEKQGVLDFINKLFE